MAKKKKTTGTTLPPTDSTHAAPAGRRTTRRAVPPEPPPAPLDLASVTRAEPPSVAADSNPPRTGASGATATHHPTYEEIAEVAYQLYLRRGGGDGGDLDDWLEAERELRLRDR